VLLVSHDRRFHGQRGHQHSGAARRRQRRRTGRWLQRLGGARRRLLPLNTAEPSCSPQRAGGTDPGKPRRAGAGTPRAQQTIAPKAKKLSYREQRELEDLPAAIEALESRQEELQALSADPSFYARDPQEVKTLLAELSALGQELEGKIERWTELEDRA
jgi:ATP-binding cassette subfamily F protein uup